MPRLVDSELGPVGQPDRGEQAPALLVDILRDLHAFGAKIGKCGAKVVTRIL
jgi:hypothetical protein